MKKTMGAGTVYLILAQIITVLSNYIIYVFLGRSLGPEKYGVFGVLMSLYLMNRAFLNQGVPTAVSKFISESKTDVNKIISSSFHLQLIISLIFGILYLIFAKNIASLLKDNSLSIYIMFLGIMVIPLSIVPLYNGFLSGLRQFKKQALFRTSFPISRVIFTFILVFLGLGIFGALMGYFLSLIFAIFIGHLFMKKIYFSNEKFQGFSKKIIKFAIPLAIASLALAQTRNINTLFLKYFLIDNFTLGLYTAATTLSNTPYLIFMALPQTLLPSISKSIAENNLPLTRRYISKSLRYLLIILLPLTFIIFATSEELIFLIYSTTYINAAPILSILIISSTLLTIFSTFLSVITGSGKPYLFMAINIFLVTLLSILNLIFIPSRGVMGAAFASLISSVIALIIVTTYIFIKYKIIYQYISSFKIIFCSLVVFFVAKNWVLQGINLIFSYTIYAAIYFLLLYLFGEISRKDFKVFLK